jgi:hypothetical protein
LPGPEIVLAKPEKVKRELDHQNGGEFQETLIYYIPEKVSDTLLAASVAVS